jgi:predicted nucleotidyltransferase
MMKTREEVLNILRQARHDLSSRYPITRITLFGSYARGQQQEDSDIDILIDVDPSIGLRFVTLANELEGLLGQRVELVTSRAIAPKMKSLLEADSIEVA